MVSRDSISERIRRRAFIRRAGAAGIVGLAGCAGGNSDDGTSENTDGGGDTDGATTGSSGNSGTIELSYWTLFTGGDGKAMKQLVDKFNEEHDNIQIKRERQPFDQYYDKLYTSMQGGNAPDLAVIHSSKQLTFHDGLYQLDDYTSGDPYIDTVWERTAPTGDHYGLPLGTFANGLYYNKDIFEAAGLDPENPPSNYGEFETAANAIVENTDKLAFNPEPYGGAYNYMFQAWVKAKGGDFLTDDNSEAAFDSPEGHAVGQFYHDIGANGWDQKDSSGMRGIKAFRSGNMGMVLNGTWFQLALEDADVNWGHTKPWVLPDMKQKLTWAGTHIMTLPRKPDKSEEEIKASVTAAEWLTQEATIWATVAGHVPTTKGITESEEITNSDVWEKTLKDYVEMVNDDQIAYWPIVQNRDDYTRPIDQNVAQIYAHQLAPKEGIKKTAQEVTNNLQS